MKMDRSHDYLRANLFFFFTIIVQNNIFDIFNMVNFIFNVL